MHACSKDSGKWPTIASRLYDEGYACLRFNFRGCGEGPERSEGKFEDVSLTGRMHACKFRNAFSSLSPHLLSKKPCPYVSVALLSDN